MVCVVAIRLLEKNNPTTFENRYYNLLELLMALPRPNKTT